jgi:hypothetical protein
VLKSNVVFSCFVIDIWMYIHEVIKVVGRFLLIFFDGWMCLSVVACIL